MTSLTEQGTTGSTGLADATEAQSFFMPLVRGLGGTATSCLRPLGLSRTEYLVLSICADLGRASKAELASRLSVSELYIGKLVGRLAIERRLAWAGNRQRSYLTLTTSGQELLAYANAVLADWDVPLAAVLAEHHAKLRTHARKRPAVVLQAPEEPITATSPLSVLPLPVATYNTLRRNGIHTVDGLIATPPAELQELRGIGTKALDDIAKALRTAGLATDSADSGLPPSTPDCTP